MTSYLVVRNKRTGYVTFVGRARVEGVSRTVEYVCGLGMMDQAEFKAFQKWAHSMKDQEMRKQQVLASPLAVEEKKEVTERVATEAQKKTTVKRAKRVTIVKDKYTPEEREAARERFRREYEEKKGLAPVKTMVRRVKRVDGIRFTRGQTTMEKRRILDERITQLKIHIDNAWADIRQTTRISRVGGAQRIADAKERVEKYTEAMRILRKQRAELRR